MSFFNYTKDPDGIVTLLMDDPGKPVNVMNDDYAAGLAECVDQLEADLDNVTGVIVASGKSTFFAGGNLDEILAVSPENCEKYLTKVLGIKKSMRRLETMGKPVVCAINGAALGGGYEICLGTHHRIAIDSPKVVVGMPEVTLGLLPGGGGVVRSVRMLGLQQALPLLLTGSKIPAKQALEMGLVDQLVASAEDLISAAKTWINENPDAAQPWDREGYEFPEGGYNSTAIQSYISQQIVTLKATKRGLYPADQGILSAAVESMQVDFETANVIETRYLTHLAQTPEGKNLMTYFFQSNTVRAGPNRPADQPKSQIEKIGILGASTMAAGIADLAAKSGIEVVQMEQSLDDLNSCDLLIEAVSEYGELHASVAPENYIGLHFFSAVDRAQLVEIITSEETSEETLARAYDFCKQIRKLPIVVSNSPGFYTSRVHKSYCDEGALLLSDGVTPVLIENCALQVGMPAGSLNAVLEEQQPGKAPEVPVQDIKDRILFRPIIEALRCLDEGVLHSVAECNIGSIMGLGFPAYTGGQLQYINSYGVSDFCKRAQELAYKYDERFAPPQILLRHAETNTHFI